MKKSMILCLGALLSFAVAAEEPAPAPAPEGDAPRAPRFERGMRGPRQAPLMINVTEKTTAEEIEAFKKQVLEKIDSSVDAYKAKPAEDGKEKPAMHIGLMVMERRPGMGPGMRPGMRGQRGGEMGPRGPRGPRGQRHEGEKPAPAPQAE